jgi:hypothetical protein
VSPCRPAALNLVPFTIRSYLAGGEYEVMASPTADKTSGKPRRNRRWLQFCRATLLGLVTLT